MVEVAEITVYRDGGTITFTITGGQLDGGFRLRTPFSGLPRPVYRDGVQLELGGHQESALAMELEAWLAATLTPTQFAALSCLDAMKMSRNLAPELADLRPFQLIRTVVQLLRERRR